jgi:cytochrome c oxidase subunit 2
MVTGWPHLSNPADDAFFFILGISVMFLVANTAIMLYFVIRYSRKRNPVPSDVKDSLLLEITWTVIPTLLVLAMFFVGWKGFQYMRTAPPDAMVVKVTARSWSWTFDYANGRESAVLNVPVGRPVKLLITSTDVVHSLYIPAYRIKEDAVPGRETHLWFLPDEPGSYDLFCTEYCGVGHSAMITKVEVMAGEDFEAWYNGKKEVPAKGEKADVAGAAKKTAISAPPDEGGRLIQVKGCIACHSADGTPKIGPTFRGVFGKQVVVVRNGQERQIVVDEAFIRQTLLHPEIDRVKGFPPIMPSQQGQLSDKEIEEIIEHIRSLK